MRDFKLTEAVAWLILFRLAEVAEQADAHDSKSCSFGSVGSIPTFGMILLKAGKDYMPRHNAGQVKGYSLKVSGPFSLSPAVEQ